MRPKSNVVPTPTGNLHVSLGQKPTVRFGLGGRSVYQSENTSRAGLLMLNADDWGRNHETTDRTLECVVRGSISSISAMVFMQDSVRAAAIARERGIDAGLHLNFTEQFSAPTCPARLVESQRELAKRLLQHRLSPVLFYPALMQPFREVVSAQLNEFCHLYGAPPKRIDGHHHMHLCANVLMGQLLPSGTRVRRNFSFRRGEKSFANRVYRTTVDRVLAKRHYLVDFFFSLDPLDSPGRLQNIFALARDFVVEIETHPANPEEYSFLMGEEIRHLTTNLRWGPPKSASTPNAATQ